MSGSVGLGNRATVVAAIKKLGDKPFSIEDLARETQLPVAYCQLVVNRLEAAGPPALAPRPWFARRIVIATRPSHG